METDRNKNLQQFVDEDDINDDDDWQQQQHSQQHAQQSPRALGRTQKSQSKKRAAADATLEEEIDEDNELTLTLSKQHKVVSRSSNRRKTASALQTVPLENASNTQGDFYTSFGKINRTELDDLQVSCSQPQQAGALFL